MTVLNENIRAKTSLNRKDTIWKKIVKQRQLLVLSVPFMIFVLVFNYLPIWGWIMAFQKFVPGKGIFGSEFVGLANFKEAFTDSNFINAIRNTLLTSILKISTSFVSAILLA